MGISIADAREMSLWEYQGVLHENNALHDPKGPQATPPDASRVRADLDRIGSDSRYTH